MTYVDRLQVERDELVVRINKLAVFMATPTFSMMAEDEQERMRRQGPCVHAPL
jgi:hypothetical protein